CPARFLHVRGGRGAHRHRAHHLLLLLQRQRAHPRPRRHPGLHHVPERPLLHVHERLLPPDHARHRPAPQGNLPRHDAHRVPLRSPQGAPSVPPSDGVDAARGGRALARRGGRGSAGAGRGVALHPRPEAEARAQRGAALYSDQRMMSWRFVTFAALFVTCLLTANIMAAKLISLGGVVLTAGIVVFPVSYIVGDVLTEVWGYAAARRVIWLGFACNLLMVAAIWAGGALPPAPFWKGQAAYEEILGQAPRILAASFVAYLI